MTTQCCTKCEKIVPTDQHPDSIHQLTYCSNVACKCHQTHTTEEGWEERFDKRFTVTDSRNIRFISKPAADPIKAFIASEIQKAQVDERTKLSQVMFEEHSKALSLIMQPSVANREAQVIYNTFNMIFQAIRARITNKQSEV